MVVMVLVFMVMVMCVMMVIFVGMYEGLMVMCARRYRCV